jgi:CDP-diglyceride synthetase
VNGAMEKLIRSALLARATAAVAERVGETARRAAAVVLCVTLAAVFALAAGACALAALWIYLRPQIGPVLAPLAVTLLLLVLAVALLLISRLIARGKKAPAATQVIETGAAAGDSLAALSNDALRLFQDHKSAALLAALLAGAFAARKR